MFVVLKSTYNDMETAWKGRVTENLGLEKQLRTANHTLQTAERELKREKASVKDLAEDIEGKIEELDNAADATQRAKDDTDRMKNLLNSRNKEIIGLVAKNKSIFARAGGFASQFKSLQKRILSAHSLSDLKKHAKKGIKASERKAKRRDKK